MTESLVPLRGHARHRDRRSGVAGLVAALVPVLRRGGDAAHLRILLEEGARRLVGADRVWLREGNREVPLARPLGPSQYVSVEVPTGDRAHPVYLDASAPSARRFDEWDVQMLNVVSQLAALVLEVERLRAVKAAGQAQGSGADKTPTDSALIGSTTIMRGLRQRIEQLAATDFTVLIEGESGTGKELVAHRIHEVSRRRQGPFVAVNCAAIVETLLEAELFGIEERTATGVRGRRGKFEYADGGTLFLDEVSDLSASAQAKLLRALQDFSVERVGGQGSHRLDIRIIVATNRSLSGMVASGTFRSDLFYRLGGVELHVPPLRMRQADVLELADHFLEQHRQTRRLTLSGPARDALLAYQWPGNVRELQRVIERLIALSARDEVGVEDLPPAIRGDFEDILLPSMSRADTMRAWGARYARLVLNRCGDNKRKACQILDISYHTLQAYLRYRDRPRVRGIVDSRWPAAALPQPNEDDLVRES